MAKSTLLQSLRRQALPHQAQQVSQRLLVGPAFCRRKLPGALVELGRHVGGLLRRTAHPREELRELGKVHETKRRR